MKNICDNKCHFLRNNVVYSDVFSDILRCRLRQGALNCKEKFFIFQDILYHFMNELHCVLYGKLTFSCIDFI
ncbi:hypothetical protein HMPREF0971_01643 [Segatella oris F0302]|uniref:Uncharacterized protein n=1 Tax=Segatella oris F0302 TaxID=649760 RepID=D1QRN7_9BACT|nr:hypothetical protein HMPREF0971_01643 [Segatella oris F0302]